MNENPGETPNPLNPTPEVGPNPEPTSNMLDANPSEPMTAEEPAPMGSPMPAKPVTQVAGTFTETVQVESLDPTGRPMEKVVPQMEPLKKKSKVGLIVGIVILLLVLIGGGVAAAIVLMNMNKPDAVAVAMNKLMSGGAPENVAIDGSIDILFNDKTSPISRLNVNLDSDIIVGSAINTSSAVLTMTTKDSQDYSVEFNEVYAANGDLYFKVDGAMAAIEDSGILNPLSSNQVQTTEMVDCSTEDEDCVVEVATTNCVGDDTGMTNCVLEPEEYTSTTMTMYATILNRAVEVIDGEWLKISTDELASMSSGLAADSPTSCIMTTIGDLNKNSNSTAQLYNKYPFINSTTEGVMIQSKENPVYRVQLNGANFAQFMNSVQNAGLTGDLYNCLGWDGNVGISEEDVAKMVSTLPKAYVEVNGNSEFSRIYIESEPNDGAMSVVVDLGLSYPRNVNVMEPVEYTDFSKVIQEIMSGMFSVNGDTIEAETVVVTE